MTKMFVYANNKQNIIMQQNYMLYIKVQKQYLHYTPPVLSWRPPVSRPAVKIVMIGTMFKFAVWVGFGANAKHADELLRKY